MRTHDEIKNQIGLWKREDFLGVMTNDLLTYLPFSHAKNFLKPEVTEEQWKEHFKELTEESVKAEMTEYIPFAWEKANNCRGISASRSMQHFKAWVWLLGDEAVSKLGDFDDYEFYGKPQLVNICDFLDIDSKQYDDGIRTNTDY